MALPLLAGCTTWEKSEPVLFSNMSVQMKDGDCHLFVESRNGETPKDLIIASTSDGEGFCDEVRITNGVVKAMQHAATESEGYQTESYPTSRVSTR